MEGVDVAFLPDDFVVPTLVAGLRFRIRPITVHDVVKAYDAVMSSRELLWERFGEVAEWPPADLTLEQLLVDLAWHQKQALLGTPRRGRLRAGGRAGGVRPGVDDHHVAVQDRALSRAGHLVVRLERAALGRPGLTGAIRRPGAGYT